MRPNAGTVTMRHSADPFSKKPASWSPGRDVAALGLLLLAATLALAPLQHIALAVALALPIASPVFGLYWAVLSVSVQDAARLPGGLSYTLGAALLKLSGWGLRVLAHPERRVVFE